MASELGHYQQHTCCRAESEVGFTVLGNPLQFWQSHQLYSANNGKGIKVPATASYYNAGNGAGIVVGIMTLAILLKYQFVKASVMAW